MPAEAKLFLAGIFRDIDFLAVRVPREDDPASEAPLSRMVHCQTPVLSSSIYRGVR